MLITRCGTQYGIVGSLSDLSFYYSSFPCDRSCFRVRMSLKLVGIMALAGISAVAAYLILVRKKVIIAQVTFDHPNHMTFLG